MIRRMLKGIFFSAWFVFNAVRLLPALALWKTSHRRELIDADVARWDAVLLKRSGRPWPTWVRLMGSFPEFRSLFYHRLGWRRFLVQALCRPEPTLHLCTADIGPGLFIQHGFATIVTARRIGADCWINQQVTIGHVGAGSPVIGDRVRVSAGAKVIGGVTVGNDVVVGANAVVVKDVPDGCTVVGVPARIVKRYGERVDAGSSAAVPQDRDRTRPEAGGA